MSTAEKSTGHLRGYPDSYYSRTACLDQSPWEQLRTSTPLHADLCIVGGGMAGLNAAQEALDRGKTVVLLEQNHIGWGASGRNGGLVSSFWSEGQDGLIAKVGRDNAKTLFDISSEGVEIVRERIQRHSMTSVNAVSGKFGVQRHPGCEGLKRKAEQSEREYGYALEFMDRPALQEHLATDIYHGGLHDPQAFHFHPLNYCLELGKALTAQGARLFEQSEMTGLERLTTDEWSVKTEKGEVRAQKVMLCGGGYGKKMDRRIGRAFLSIATYIILTEPLGDRLKSVIKTDAAVVDNRRSSDYYRIVDGDRLLWGGRISTRNIENVKRLSALLNSDVLQVYPQLDPLPIATAWSGLMGYAKHKMPHILELEPGLWTCMSYGGHGVNTTAAGARVTVEALWGDSDRYRLFSPFGLDWNGGFVGPIAAETVYLWLRLQDYWAERIKSKFRG
ncbi:NAD(P)/FAD-dependent oxidoreductase [Kiloniella sp. b19]|uniref:NAD(P)/FAD-dependent oxidoreductase n=1 Tax=Kiloniella sp. GXU_MW_B19 TaxID=3141326 RepID=UPI0031D06929